jgi:hypothetical protein
MRQVIEACARTRRFDLDVVRVDRAQPAAVSMQCRADVSGVPIER